MSGGAGGGGGLAVGAFLDGIPEQLVLGIGIASGEGVSAGLLVAIFVSNLPEALGVAVICALATPAGFAIAEATGGEVPGGDRRLRRRGALPHVDVGNR
jgi:zinc transporter, ZIP family